MRLFRKFLFNINYKLINGVKLLRIFNSFNRIRTNVLVCEKLLARRPLNYYNRLMLKLTKRFQSTLVKTNMRSILTFIRFTKVKNRTQGRLIKSLISKSFHNKHNKPVFMRNLNLNTLTTNCHYIVAKITTSLEQTMRESRHLITLLNNSTSLNFVSKHYLDTSSTACRNLLKFFIKRNLPTQTKTSRFSTPTTRELLLEKSQELQFGHPLLINLQKSYRQIVCNIAQTYNLYSPFWTKTILTIVADAKTLVRQQQTTDIPKNPLVFKLLFNFKKHYLHLTLFGDKDKVFFSIDTSLFLKFVGYKKSLKKSYSLKLLLIKYLRKLLIVSNLVNFYLHIKNTSAQLNKFLLLLQRPFNHTFKDPLLGITVGEGLDQSSVTCFNFPYIIFLQNRPYGFMKTKKNRSIKT